MSASWHSTDADLLLSVYQLRRERRAHDPEDGFDDAARHAHRVHLGYRRKRHHLRDGGAPPVDRRVCRAAAERCSGPQPERVISVVDHQEGALHHNGRAGSGHLRFATPPQSRAEHAIAHIGDRVDQQDGPKSTPFLLDTARTVRVDKPAHPAAFDGVDHPDDGQVRRKPPDVLSTSGQAPTIGP